MSTSHPSREEAERTPLPRPEGSSIEGDGWETLSDWIAERSETALGCLPAAQSGSARPFVLHLRWRLAIPAGVCGIAAFAVLAVATVKHFAHVPPSHPHPKMNVVCDDETNFSPGNIGDENRLEKEMQTTPSESLDAVSQDTPDPSSA